MNNGSLNDNTEEKRRKTMTEFRIKGTPGRDVIDVYLTSDKEGIHLQTDNVTLATLKQNADGKGYLAVRESVNCCGEDFEVDDEDFLMVVGDDTEDDEG